MLHIALAAGLADQQVQHEAGDGPASQRRSQFEASRRQRELPICIPLWSSRAARPARCSASAALATADALATEDPLATADALATEDRLATADALATAAATAEFSEGGTSPVHVLCVLLCVGLCDGQMPAPESRTG